MGKYEVYISDIWRACCSTHWALSVQNTRQMSRRTMAQMKTTQLREEDHLRIQWSSSGPYFDVSFLVVDITFRHVL